jgi:hypothetical protein
MSETILLQNTLQAGATFYVSSGTVNTFKVGNSITLPNASIADAALSANVSLLGSAIDSSEITDGTIVDADINTSAGIGISKLATSGTLGANVIVSSIAVGAITNENQIVDGVITNNDLAGSISPSKITNTAAVLTANTFTGAQTFGSGASITVATGLNEVLVGTSVVITNGGITASSGTFTVVGATQYSIETSSSIKVNTGPVMITNSDIMASSGTFTGTLVIAKAVATNTTNSRFHIPKLTQASIEGLTPADVGDLFYNTDKNVVCVSAGTTPFAVAYSSETTTRVW